MLAGSIPRPITFHSPNPWFSSVAPKIPSIDNTNTPTIGKSQGFASLGPMNRIHDQETTHSGIIKRNPAKTVPSAYPKSSAVIPSYSVFRLACLLIDRQSVFEFFGGGLFLAHPSSFQPENSGALVLAHLLMSHVFLHNPRLPIPGLGLNRSKRLNC
jgi:hypothetical protein